LKREGYTKTDLSLRDAWESLTFPGLYRFISRHRAATVDEIRTTVSRGFFLRKLQRLVPAITRDDFEPGGAGVRAQAMDRRGNLINDFLFEEKPGQLHVLNAPSPGATASLAIGHHIAQKVRARVGKL
jgi:L-2-hydroxyglutarate oxidase